jgi:hypothetical protein
MDADIGLRFDTRKGHGSRFSIASATLRFPSRTGSLFDQAANLARRIRGRGLPLLVASVSVRLHGVPITGRSDRSL